MPDLAAWLPPAHASLGALFVVSFLAATLLPLASELWLVVLLRARPDLLAPALVVATLGNTAGSLTTYALGRAGRLALDPKLLEGRRAELLRRRGAPVLLFAWLPLLGDLLCALAGWLRLPPGRVTAWLALGKAGRYAALAWMTIRT